MVICTDTLNVEELRDREYINKKPLSFVPPYYASLLTTGGLSPPSFSLALPENPSLVPSPMNTTTELSDHLFTLLNAVNLARHHALEQKNDVSCDANRVWLQEYAHSIATTLEESERKILRESLQTSNMSGSLKFKSASAEWNKYNK